MRTVELAHETDIDGFRQAARRLLADGTAPEQVHWRIGLASAQAPLFDSLATDPGAGPAQDRVPALQVPRWYGELAGQLIRHAHPDRLALLYRLLWRLAHEPALRHDSLDPDRILAHRMARSVSREIHKMHAFVRFRPVRESPGQPAEHCLHLAWFDPVHHVLEAAAPFFVRRFANLRWSLLTPALSAHWDGQALRFDGGVAQPPAAPADDAAGEALWLAYYRSIFNPARLKTAAMMREMPRRYWPAMPETRLVSELVRNARESAGRMIESGQAFASERDFP